MKVRRGGFIKILSQPPVVNKKYFSGSSSDRCFVAKGILKGSSYQHWEEIKFANYFSNAQFCFSPNNLYSTYFVLKINFMSSWAKADEWRKMKVDKIYFLPRDSATCQFLLQTTLEEIWDW